MVGQLGFYWWTGDETICCCTIIAEVNEIVGEIGHNMQTPDTGNNNHSSRQGTFFD